MKSSPARSPHVAVLTDCRSSVSEPFPAEAFTGPARAAQRDRVVVVTGTGPKGEAALYERCGREREANAIGSDGVPLDRLVVTLCPTR